MRREADMSGTIDTPELRFLHNCGNSEMAGLTPKEKTGLGLELEK